jgi:hypothetical protein
MSRRESAERPNRWAANPVYVDGRLVKSRFAAADAAGVSTVALWKALRKSGGAPCVVNGRSVFSAEWFEEFKRGEAGE